MKVYFKTKKGNEMRFENVTKLRCSIYKMFPNRPLINLGLIDLIELAYGEIDKCVINKVRVK